MPSVTSPSAYREAAGLTVDQAARRARICTAYLRRIERTGGAPYVLAERLAKIYHAPVDAFVWRVRKKGEQINTPTA